MARITPSPTSDGNAGEAHGLTGAPATSLYASPSSRRTGVRALRATRPLAGSWLWLFPATYLVHVLEELVADFPAWLRRISGTAFGTGQFLALNAAAWLVMCTATLWASRRPGALWLVPALGSAVTANAVLHLGGSALSATYSPGALSAALLWVPLGAFALRRAWTALPPARFAAGVAAGLAAHAVVSLLALSLGG